ncbi:hypothetical protein Nepgr_020485 [Nepenthes gracilis]|uniref:Uncharacterized protein n=1 Tax=Nepenthes gracilis TaxID=150966 RepID=A0AAD3XW37_NEPGR|nr:hypothetical protein Nepgr_020485 [Nepenthes gracilis]
MASLVLLLTEFLHPHRILDYETQTHTPASTAAATAAAAAAAVKLNQAWSNGGPRTENGSCDDVDAVVEEDLAESWAFVDLVWP